MSSVSRYQYLLGRFSWIALVAALAGALLLGRAYYRIPVSAGHYTHQVDPVERSRPTTNAVCDWSVFQARDGSVQSISGTSRFRLAGTFFEYVSDVTGTGDVRRAIIDNLRTGTQVIVKELEKVDETTTVVKIFRDRVIIRDASGSDEQLWLTFSGLGMSTKQAGTTNAPNEAAKDDLGGLDNFGGKQIDENKWVFSREKLLEYYKGLRDEPERLVKVFDSLKPVYVGGGNKIDGYRLGIEGEADFFKAVGLKEGDVVKGVNSMQMTNRRRAEYFIGEFVADRANAFILDVERGGKTEKLTYEVR